MGEDKKDCNGCYWAKWDRTQAGRMANTGDGNCTYPIKTIVTPSAYFWAGGVAPRPIGGLINRRRKLSEECPTREEK